MSVCIRWRVEVEGGGLEGLRLMNADDWQQAIFSLAAAGAGGPRHAPAASGTDGEKLGSDGKS